jgi:hypothetical protein
MSDKQATLPIEKCRRGYPSKPPKKGKGGCDVCGGFLHSYEPGDHPNYPESEEYLYVCEWCRSTITSNGEILDRRLPEEEIIEMAKRLVKENAT